MKAEMFEFLIFFTIVIFLTTFTIIVLRLKNQNLKLIFLLSEAISDIEIFKNKFASEPSVEKEHLISFLNETRDTAYQYIEDVHKALLEYKSEIEYDLINPSELSIHRFRNAFDKLQRIYPEDIPND